MRYGIWIIMFYALNLAGCHRPVPPLCKSLIPPPDINDVAGLVKKEPELARWVLYIDDLGQINNCWKKRNKNGTANT